MPDAVAAADAMGLGDRFTGQAGDFFAAVPPADLYLLKYILHDWDDEQCVRLLRNCRQSLTETGRVVVVELLVGQPGEPGVAPLMDMGMLVLQTGRERELGEYDRLFTAAGLRMVRVQPTRSPFVVLEAVPR